jgi:hypothetical protein
MTGASRWILFTTIIVDARNHEPENLSLHVECSEFYTHISVKVAGIQFYGYQSSGSHADSCGKTDSQTKKRTNGHDAAHKRRSPTMRTRLKMSGVATRL